MRFLSSRPLFAACAIFCFLAAGPLRAQEARAPSSDEIPLGSTPQQIASLYGPVLRHNARVRRHEILAGGTVIDGDLYSHNDLVVRAVYHGGVAVLLEYTRIGGPLTVHDVTLLLAANADATATWEPGKDNTDARRAYRRSDGKALAHFTTEFDGSLLIATDNVGSDFYGDQLLGH